MQRSKTSLRLAADSALLAALFALPGCARSPLAIDEPWRQRLEQAERWRSHDGEASADAGAIDVREPGQLRTAEDYVKLALLRHPAIRSAEAKVRRLHERAPQLRSLDDPMLTVVPVGEMAETAAGQVAVMTTLSQRLPLTSKLEVRGRVAELDAAQAQAELEQTRLQVAADTRRAYWSLYFAVRAMETTEKSRSLLAQMRDVADAQYRTGRRNQQDVLRATAELGSLEAELAALQQRRETAEAMLRQLIDAPASQPIETPQVVKEDEIILKRDALLARAAEDNPAIQRVSKRIAQFEAQQRLAELNRVPDLTVSLSYNIVEDRGLSRVANGDDQWWVGFGFNLPIWAEKYDAAEREALFGRLEAASELAAERNRITFQVEDAVARLEAQREVLRLLRQRVIPDAVSAVEAAAAGYRAGTGDFLMLVDNWRKLLSYQLMEHRALADLEQALADLERAVGSQIDRRTGEPVRGDEGSPAGIDKESNS